MNGSTNNKQIWIVSDGKPGHLNQSRGLAEAIARQREGVVISEQPPMGRLQALWLCFSAGLPVMEDKPALVIGAGHATHLTLLALRRLYGVPAVVLMKPSIPMGFFDLCLVPEHDQPPQRPNIIATRGALNRMQPGDKKPGSGVILIGGPSKHFDWDENQVLEQVKVLLATGSDDWIIGSSRRTPASTEQALAALAGDHFVSAAETGPDWLPEQMARAEVCWVTQDSASMVYEALTAGCRLGILELGGSNENRLQQGIQRLLQEGVITTFHEWQDCGVLSSGTCFDEAARCADEVIRRGWV